MLAAGWRHRGYKAPVIGCLIVITTWAWPSAVAEQPLAFTQALVMLAERNEYLAAERQVLGQARADLNNAQGRRLPEVTLTAGYVRLDQPISIDLSPVRGVLQQLDPSLPPGLLPGDIELQKRQFGAVAARTRWPLYTGGRISAGINAAEAAVAASQASLDGTRGTLELLLVERYFAQVLTAEAYQVKTATVDTLNNHLRHAQLLQEQGQIAQAEVLRAQVALSEAQVEQVSARHQHALARAALSALLASDDGFQLITPLPAPPVLPPLEPLLEQALVSNPSLRSAREQRLRAEAGIKAARGEHLPTVALFGQRELYTKDLDLLTSEWVVGLAMEWHLLGGGSVRSRVDSAQLKADEVSYRLASGTRDLALLVRQRHSQLADALNRIETYTGMQALAEESLRAQRRAFEEGMASSLDVVDAELALQRVALGQLAARYESLVALSGLWEASGQRTRIGEWFLRGDEYGNGE